MNEATICMKCRFCEKTLGSADFIPMLITKYFCRHPKINIDFITGEIVKNKECKVLNLYGNCNFFQLEKEKANE